MIDPLDLKSLTIEDYSWLDFNLGRVHVHTMQENNRRYFTASVSLNIDDKTPDGLWTYMETHIKGECKYCVATNAASLVQMLAGAVDVEVLLFGINSEVLATMNLNAMEHEEFVPDIMDDFINIETGKDTLH